MKAINIIHVFILLVISLHSHSQIINVGDKIQTLGIEKYLQAPNDHYSLEDFKGKPIVLEFWATWCAPCIALFPKFNELHKQFEKDMTFIAVTNEDEYKVKKLLSRYDIVIDPWIGLDTDNSLHKALQIDAIPKAVLIHPNGEVAAIERSYFINEKMLNNFLSGAPLYDTTAANASVTVDPDTKGGSPDQIVVPGSKESLLRVNIEETGEKNDWGLVTKIDSNKITTIGYAPLSHLLNIAFGLSNSRMNIPDSILDKMYKIDVEVSQSGKGSYNDFLKSILLFSLSYDFHLDTQSTGVLILKPASMKNHNLIVNTDDISRFTAYNGVISGTGQPISILVSKIEQISGIPIIDESGLTKKYDWTITYDPDEPHSIIKSVEKQLGLNLVKGTSSLEVLTLQKRNSDN